MSRSSTPQTEEERKAKIAAIKALAEKAKAKLTAQEYLALVAVIKGTIK